MSKVDESIEIDGEKFDIYTNLSKNYISQGYKYLKKFRKEYVPIYTYMVKDVEITKMICLEYGKNTVGIYYKIKNQEHNSKLILTPLINFRNFHYTSDNHNFEINQEFKNGKLEVILDNKLLNTIYMKVSDSTYIKHENDSFKNMFYPEEEKRGFIAEENHAIPGRFEIEINPNEEKEISFICSLEENIDEITAKRIIDKEIVRLNELFNKSLIIDNRKTNKSEKELERDKLMKTFLIATDSFIIYRPNFRTYSMLAGYPWFLDWSRDTLISFEGNVLLPKRFDIAKSILETCTRDIKYGLAPNGYSEADDRPLYNSVDASLLLFEQVQKYIDYTGDYKFVKETLYEKLESIIKNYKNGIDLDDNNIHLEEDGLIASGTENTQNTWMDAKYNGIAVTPRNGKVVEINALWYNALKIMESLAKKFGNKKEEKEYFKLAEKTKKSFNEKFYNKRRNCLYDVLGDSKIRPNQLFSLSLTYPVINPASEEAKNIIDVVEKKLLTPYGLKSLAKGEPNYVEIYEGDGFKRDTSYHQGITWTWLLGLYYNSLQNMFVAEKSKKEKENLKNKILKLKSDVENTFTKELYENGCIGGIAEIYDSVKPYKDRGTISQAWSIAEIFRIIK